MEEKGCGRVLVGWGTVHSHIRDSEAGRSKSFFCSPGSECFWGSRLIASSLPLATSGAGLQKGSL